MLQSGSLHMDLHGVHTHTSHHKPESTITHPPTSPPASTQICVPHQTHSHNKHTQQPPHRTHIHPNSFPPEPKCFRILFAPATPPRQTFECGCSLVLASSASCGKCLGVYASISPPVGPLIGLPSLHAFLLTPLGGLPPSLDPRGLFPALGPNRHAENIYLKPGGFPTP